MGYLVKRIKSQLLSEQPGDGPLGDYSADVQPPSRSAAPVSLDRAVTLPAVYRAVQILAAVGSQLTLQSWRNRGPVEPTPNLLLAPDPWRDLGAWIERAIINLATDGNLFLRRHRDPGGLGVASLEVLDSFRTVERWQRGVKSYTTWDHRTGRFIDLKADEVQHVWGLQLPGHTRGVGPITACRAAFGGILNIRDYADGWFDDSDVPSGVLSSDQQLDPASVRQYRRIWHDPEAFDNDETNDSTRRLGPQIRVLGRGLSYSPIMLKPEDAQWIEAQNFGVLDVARMFGLPADYLHAAVEGKNLTYSNLEMIDTQFMRLTLVPSYLRKIESALTTALPAGQTARFDLADWLRPDAKTRSEINKTYIDAGVLSPQDVRDAERIPGAAPGRPAAAAPAAAPDTTPAPTEEQPV